MANHLRRLGECGRYPKGISLTHFDDMTACDYFGDCGDTILAVGWLSRFEPFATGQIDVHSYAKLKQLFADPWQPVHTMGVHECDLCQFDGAAGRLNLFLPFNGKLLVCPELVVHYISCHNYLPPNEFIEAVRLVEDTRSLAYKKSFLESGGRALLASVG